MMPLFFSRVLHSNMGLSFRALDGTSTWEEFIVSLFLLLFDDNKGKMARKPGKKQKENPVGCIGEGKT